jgi:hypothetical protein
MEVVKAKIFLSSMSYRVPMMGVTVSSEDLNYYPVIFPLCISRDNQEFLL